MLHTFLDATSNRRIGISIKCKKRWWIRAVGFYVLRGVVEMLCVNNSNNNNAQIYKGRPSEKKKQPEDEANRMLIMIRDVQLERLCWNRASVGEKTPATKFYSPAKKSVSHIKQKWVQQRQQQNLYVIWCTQLWTKYDFLHRGVVAPSIGVSMCMCVSFFEILELWLTCCLWPNPPPSLPNFVVEFWPC